MSTLDKAPLIETIFELRWGEHTKKPDGSTQLTFPDEERQLLPGKFQAHAEEHGFGVIETVNDTQFPHLVSFRYRKQPDQWPCFQTGLGIFTANQVNEGYDWESFRENCKLGLNILDKSHSSGLESLPAIGAELRYQDGFYLDRDETAYDFLKNKLEIDFDISKNFLDAAFFDGKTSQHRLQFAVKTIDPAGLTIVSIYEARINGNPGMVMDTKVRSADDYCPQFNIHTLDTWLESAHKVQQHAFKKLINPAFARSFK